MRGCRGGDTQSKNAVISKWLCVETGKIATIAEHVEDLLQTFTRADPATIGNSIRRHGQYYGHKFERIHQC
jgi:hypothetical protein